MELLTDYHQEVERLQPAQRSVAGVLYACVVTICRNQAEDKENRSPPNINTILDEQGAPVELHPATSHSSFEGLLSAKDSAVANIEKQVVLNADDKFVKQYASLDLFLSKKSNNNQEENDDYEHVSQKGLKSFELNAIVRRQIYRLLQKNQFPIKPTMSEAERGMMETELLTFTSLCSSDLYRSNQLQLFSDMIFNETKPAPNFTGSALQGFDGEDGSVLRRKYFRHHSAFVLAQILVREQITEPKVLSKYYDMTDELLYCLNWPSLERRNRRTLWKYDFANAMQLPVNIQEDPIDIALETMTLTPAGKMTVRVSQFKHQMLSPWISAYISDATLGMQLVQSNVNLEVNEVVQDGNTTAIEGIEKLSTERPSNECRFSYHTEDDVRFHGFIGPSPKINRKPDKFGTVCFKATFPNDLSVTICSNGNMSITSNEEYLLSQSLEYPVPSSIISELPGSHPQQTLATIQEETGCGDDGKTTPYCLFTEKKRFIGKDGVVIRTFFDATSPFSSSSSSSPQRKHPFDKEILYPNGSRELHLMKDFKKYCKHHPFPSEWNNFFEIQLIPKLPSKTNVVVFTADGEIQCYQQSADGSTAQISARVSIPFQHENILTATIDAENKSEVHYFADHRMVIHYEREQILYCLFPDQSKFITYQAFSIVAILRMKGWPCIEMDLELDNTCRFHSQGMEIPINKGGERVRSRIGLPDGTACFIKYDSRVTAKFNGSIKVVRRNKNSILMCDDATVTFSPCTTWSHDALAKFEKDCKIDDDFIPSNHIYLTHYMPMTMVGMISQSSAPTLMPPNADTLAAATSNPALTAQSSKVSSKTSKAATATSSKTQKSGLGGQKSGKVTFGENKSSLDLTAVNKNISQHDLFASETEVDAVVTMNLSKATCYIKDNELNSFEIDLLRYHKYKTSPPSQEIPSSPSNPLIHQATAASLPSSPEAATHSVEGEATDESKEAQPMEPIIDSALDVAINLAGEVPGLKPPAVTKPPKPPRLFVIKRNCEAMEVLSVQDIRDYEHQVKVSTDIVRHDSNGVHMPNELGEVTIRQYFTMRKLLGSYLDGFLFSEIFGHRNYQSIQLSTTAVYRLMQKMPWNYMLGLQDHLETARQKIRLFDSLTVFERMPLSNEGYNGILLALKRCEEFREKRVQSLDRFAVEDTRTPTQIKEEEEMLKRLKQVYKAAKVIAAKKKELKFHHHDDDEEDEGSQAGGGGSVSSKGSTTSNSKAGSKKPAAIHPPLNNQTILEGQNEDDDEGEDDDDHFGSDDEEAELSPDEAAIKSAFDDFAAPSKLEGWTSEMIPIDALQEVFIRLFNQFIPMDLIDRACLQTEEIDPSLEEFTLQEFRSIFRSLEKLLNMTEEERQRLKTPQMKSLSYDAMEMDGGDEGYGYEESYSHLDTLPSRESHSAGGYFGEVDDRSRSRSAPKGVARTTPALNLQALHAQPSKSSKGSVDDFSFQSSKKTHFENQTYEQSHAAGPAMHAVRKSKTNNNKTK